MNFDAPIIHEPNIFLAKLASTRRQLKLESNSEDLEFLTFAIQTFWSLIQSSLSSN